MAIYDLADPTAPELISFATTAERGERFRHIGQSRGNVVCTVALNPNYEAHFSMTTDHAREVAVRLIDAAEEAEVHAEKLADERRQAEELIATRKRPRR